MQINNFYSQESKSIKNKMFLISSNELDIEFGEKLLKTSINVHNQIYIRMKLCP